MRAEEIAKLGYVAFAIDMYGKGVFAKDHEEAGKLVRRLLQGPQRRCASGRPPASSA